MFHEKVNKDETDRYFSILKDNVTFQKASKYAKIGYFYNKFWKRKGNIRTFIYNLIGKKHHKVIKKRKRREITQ